MSRRVGRGSVVSSLAVCAALVGPVGAAQASDAGLRATVKAAIPKIDRSQAKILDGLATYEKNHSTTALIEAIKGQNGTLKTLKGELAGEAPSTSAGAKGKAEIIKGLGLIVTSNASLTKDLQKATKGTPVSKATLKATVNLAKKGNADLNAGGKLLQV